MEKKNNSKVSGCQRREFLVRLPLAAAAVTLSGSLGFPIAAGETDGTIFIKLGSREDGIWQLPVTDLTNLRKGSLNSVNFKISASTDQKEWKTLSANVTDKLFLNQLAELVRNR
jgi:hypothetical protein